MAPITDWHSIIAADSHHLPPDRPTLPDNCARLVLSSYLVPRFKAAANDYPMPTIARSRQPILLMCTLAGPDLPPVLMISSIVGRSSMGSTFTRRCWLLAVRSSAHLSNSAACARGHSILVHRLKRFMWMSSIEPMGGRWSAASLWLMNSTPRRRYAICAGVSFAVARTW